LAKAQIMTRVVGVGSVDSVDSVDSGKRVDRTLHVFIG
jgi:hypothetical protein